MELVDKVNLMAKVYCKGFSGSLGGSFDGCSVYLKSNEDEWKDHTLLLLNHVEEFYRNIDYDELGDDPDFEPIYAISELLPKYGKLVVDFLDNSTAESLIELYNLHKTIKGIGELYQDHFDRVRTELGKVPGYGDHSFVVKDTLAGEDWEFSVKVELSSADLS